MHKKDDDLVSFRSSFTLTIGAKMNRIYQGQTSRKSCAHSLIGTCVYSEAGAKTATKFLECLDGVLVSSMSFKACMINVADDLG